MVRCAICAKTRYSNTAWSAYTFNSDDAMDDRDTDTNLNNCNTLWLCQFNSNTVSSGVVAAFSMSFARSNMKSNACFSAFMRGTDTWASTDTASPSSNRGSNVLRAIASYSFALMVKMRDRCTPHR